MFARATSVRKEPGKPCAIATSSPILRSCSMFERVGATAPESMSPSVPILVASNMRENSAACAVPKSARSVQLLMYDARAVACVSSGPA
jgi:hypothetical protein